MSFHLVTQNVLELKAREKKMYFFVFSDSLNVVESLGNVVRWWDFFSSFLTPGHYILMIPKTKQKLVHTKK